MTSTIDFLFTNCDVIFYLHDIERKNDMGNNLSSSFSILPKNQGDLQASSCDTLASYK